MNSYKVESITFFVSRVLRRLPINKKVKNNKEIFSDSNNGPIWIFWWQGERKMPRIVYQCYKSLLKNKGNRQVILITQKNYYKYTDISSNIIDLVNQGNITLTHFSDILIFNL